MSAVWSVLGQVLVLAGAAIFLLAAVGLRRFADAYGRTSAVATAAALGVAFVTVGAAMLDPRPADVVKVVLAVVLQLLTSAVGAIAIARAAVNSGHAFSADTDVAELRTDQQAHQEED